MGETTNLFDDLTLFAPSELLIEHLSCSTLMT